MFNTCAPIISMTFYSALYCTHSWLGKSTCLVCQAEASPFEDMLSEVFPLFQCRSTSKKKFDRQQRKQKTMRCELFSFCFISRVINFLSVFLLRFLWCCPLFAAVWTAIATVRITTPHLLILQVKIDHVSQNIPSCFFSDFFFFAMYFCLCIAGNAEP